ncbi:MAG TPA: tetratricopeptide repeat protein, partial [Acidimicrobiales bacterium]|nr:tetratricopeptide repeat protein [Acidimicrobiales bacterium]
DRYDRRPNGAANRRASGDRYDRRPASGDRDRYERRPTSGDQDRYDRRPERPADRRAGGDRDRYDRRPDGAANWRAGADRRQGSGRPSGGDRYGSRSGGPGGTGDRRSGGDRYGERYDRRPDGPDSRRSGGDRYDRDRYDRGGEGRRGGGTGGRRDGTGDRFDRRTPGPAGGSPGPARRPGPAEGRSDRTWSSDRTAGPPVNRNWGGVARRGARSLSEDGSRESASDIWRDAVSRSEKARGRPDQSWEPEETWVLEPDEETAARPVPAPPAARPPLERDVATGREGAPSPGGHRRTVPKPVVEELAGAAGTDRGAKLAHRIADATYAYEKERYQEARRILRSLSEEVPESAAVRELYGLVLYRTGQWVAAAKQLEAFRERSGSYDQHPVLADCYRALRRYDEAEDVWSDLRQASPSGDLVAEGRIVAAGCRADQGDLAGAILMLEKAARKVASPQERHLRQWYALADLYERAGDVVRARDLFNRVASVDPEAFDVRARLRALR